MIPRRRTGCYIAGQNPRGKTRSGSRRWICPPCNYINRLRIRPQWIPGANRTQTQRLRGVVHVDRYSTQRFRAVRSN